MTRRAFTLIELVVVVILLAVLAGLSAPRFMSLGARRAESEARAVRALLDTFAMRDAVSPEPIAIEHDPEAATLSLLVLRGGANAAPQWRPDPLIQPVVLSELAIESAFADGAALPRNGRWWVESGSAQPRPDLSLTLSRGAAGRGAVAATWRIDLPASEPHAMLVRGEPAAGGARAVDLDAAGRSDSAW